MPWARFPDRFIPNVDEAVEGAKRELREALPRMRNSEDLEAYALLLVATCTPMDRAVMYLQDCRTPDLAAGRLLLRAAERALRHAGGLELVDDFSRL